jgi:hypothetical protein
MKRKDIKRQIKKQLKFNHPYWRRLTKQAKKKLLQEIADEVMSNYDGSQIMNVPLEELIGIEDQVPAAGIRTLQEMAEYIENFHNDNLFTSEMSRQPQDKLFDPELQYADSLFDNAIINTLLAPPGYSPAHRQIHPYQLFRMEVLKTIKYPEISYRKFCTDEYFGQERQQNRAFVGLPPDTNDQIDHTELCHFRMGLSFRQTMNMMVYTLHHFYQSGCLENVVIHGVDSSELPMETNYPLCTIKVNGKKVRIYTDPDCDCGKRRNKRDKSTYVIGYRMHTLTAINPSTGHSFPLLSIVGAANHHDSLFLTPLIKLAQSMGIEMKLITADEAYHDGGGGILKETGVHVITPPSKKVSLPDNVQAFPLRVTCNEHCHIPMKFIGKSSSGHEFACNAEPCECLFETNCLKFRKIPFDSGHFQPMPTFLRESEEAINIRKHIERPFNLMKKREGLEQTRVRSQHGVIVRSAFTTIATLVLEMAGTRRKQSRKQDKQMDLFAATG